MHENRRYKRITLKGMDIKCKMLVATEVKILNISLSGASISLRKRLNMGKQYKLDIVHGNTTISLLGTIMWECIVSSERNERGEMVPIYEGGIKFNDVLSDKGSELVNYIEHHFVSEHFKPRLRGLRVEIIQPEKTSITTHHKNYYVNKISQSGMLIETDQELEVESRFDMELNFPELKDIVKILGRVASCSLIPGKTPKTYEAGIEFIKMNKNDQLKIKKFIDSSHAK